MIDRTEVKSECRPGPHWIGKRRCPPVLNLGAMLQRATSPRPRAFSLRWRDRLLATLLADPQLLESLAERLEAGR